ncbi:MAG: hypothetical protein R3B09_05465 [Nannocystaceae bacterium]
MASRLALFSHPLWDQSGKLISSDPFLVDQILALLDQAGEGTQIRGSIARWAIADAVVPYDRLLGALKNAWARGCDLRLVAPALTTGAAASGGTIDRASKLASELRLAFGGNVRHWASAGPSGCEVVNHNTFLLFSTIAGGATRWVIVDARNAWTPRGVERPDDALILADERALYVAYLRYWLALWMRAGGEPEVIRHPTVVAGEGGLKAHFAPLAESDPDPLVSLLDSVIPTSKSVIRVAMSTWAASGRGKTILDRLLTLAGAGCDVRVVAHHDLQALDDDPAARCSVNPKGGDPIGECETASAVWAKIAGAAGVRWAKSPVHSKYILVESQLAGGGDSIHKIVVTGAGGLGPTAIRGVCADPECVLRFDDDVDLFQRYLDNWSWLCAQAWIRSMPSPCDP